MAKCTFCGSTILFGGISVGSSRFCNVECRKKHEAAAAKHHEAAPLKKCPFCAEDIQNAAIKCRFCGSMLSEAKPPIPAVSSAFSPSQLTSTSSSAATAAPLPLSSTPTRSGSDAALRSPIAKDGAKEEERVNAAAGIVGVGAFVVLKISGLPFVAAVVAGGLVFGVVFRVGQEWREGRALLREGISENRTAAMVKLVVPPIGFPLMALFLFGILSSAFGWNAFSGTPSRRSSGASGVDSEQKPSEEAAAAAFLEAWKSRGLASASALVDPRTPEGAGILEFYEALKSYENLRAVGDDSILLRQTGNTIQVRVLAVDAVVKVRGGFGFDAIRLDILVAKDSGRICMVQPQGSLGSR